MKQVARILLGIGIIALLVLGASEEDACMLWGWRIALVSGACIVVLATVAVIIDRYNKWRRRHGQKIL